MSERFETMRSINGAIWILFLSFLFTFLLSDVEVYLTATIKFVAINNNNNDDKDDDDDDDDDDDKDDVYGAWIYMHRCRLSFCCTLALYVCSWPILLVWIIIIYVLRVLLLSIVQCAWMAGWRVDLSKCGVVEMIMTQRRAVHDNKFDKSSPIVDFSCRKSHPWPYCRILMSGLHQQQCRSNVRLRRINIRLCCEKRQKYRTSLKSNVASILLPFLATIVPATMMPCSIRFEFVERTKFCSTLLPKPATLLPKKTATMSKQHSTLSKESFDL